MVETPFRILTVCTGNICRSPLAERLLQVRLGADVDVSSAGTRAVVGAPVDAAMQPHLWALGVGSDHFAARQLTRLMVREADLILCMTRGQRADVVEDEPSALRRAFTLLEFARIVSSPELPVVEEGPIADRLAGLAAVAARYRNLGGGAGPHDDVPDPYGLDEAAFEHAAELIVGGVDALAEAVSRAVAADLIHPAAQGNSLTRANHSRNPPGGRANMLGEFTHPPGHR